MTSLEEYHFPCIGSCPTLPLETRELSSSLYGVCILPQWCRKEEVPEHLDGCLQVLLFVGRFVPTMVHGMVEVSLH